MLWFGSSGDPLAQKLFAVLRQRLRGLGYVEGRTIVLEQRFADGSAQRPTRYELFLNLKTAKSLGLTIPQSVLLRADEVIQ